MDENRPTETLPEPDPAKRARGNPEGTPIRSGGREWRLAPLGLARTVTRARDRIFDDVTIAGDVAVRDIRECAMVALQVNYDLDLEETVAVIEGFDPGELADAVVPGVLVHRHQDADRTYTAWARSSLLANGIDPARTDLRDLPHVLRQLVATGRAISLGDFTSAGEYATTRADLLAMVAP